MYVFAYVGACHVSQCVCVCLTVCAGTVHIGISCVFFMECVFNHISFRMTWCSATGGGMLTTNGSTPMLASIRCRPEVKVGMALGLDNNHFSLSFAVYVSSNIQ